MLSWFAQDGVVHLAFIEHQRPAGPAYQWRPFGDGRDTDPNFDASWWSARNFLPTSRVLSVGADSTEVARIEIDRHPRRSPYQVPVRGLVREIHYIEVSRAQLGNGIGTWVVHRLVDELSDARLIASSNSAVGFWSRLHGWERFDHSEGLGHDWVLFASPRVG